MTPFPPERKGRLTFNKTTIYLFPIYSPASEEASISLREFTLKRRFATLTTSSSSFFFRFFFFFAPICRHRSDIILPKKLVLGIVASSPRRLAS
jgi:hypothetical protein